MTVRKAGFDQLLSDACAVFLTISTPSSVNSYVPQAQLWWEQEDDMVVPATGPLYSIA